MASWYRPAQPPTSYQGLGQLFGYVNSDGRFAKTNCGLAASATLLTFLGQMKPQETSSPHRNPNMALLEETFPPNILGGLAGTSRGRVERILDAHGFQGLEVQGEDQLRRTVADGKPIAVMLQIPGGTALGMTMPAGHWMVVYGWDEKQVYLTNWWEQSMTWDEFLQGWSKPLPWLINMNRKGLLARPW